MSSIHPFAPYRCWHALRRWVMPLLVLLWGLQGMAATPVITLSGDTAAFTVDGTVDVLAETGPTSGLLPVMRGARGTFVEKPADERFALGPERAIWIHLRVQRGADTPADWSLNVPLPYIDSLELYVVDSHGAVQTQKAGDTLALRHWDYPSVYPDFRLFLRDTRPVDLYLRASNYRDIEIPLRLSTGAEREQQRTLELVFCGTMLGSLLMLFTWCGLRYWETHETTEAWYLVYTVLMALVSAQAMGLANQWFWPYTPGWANYASVVLPLMGVGASTLFLRTVSATDVRHPVLDKVLLWFGAASAALILMEWALRRDVAAQLHGIYFLLGPLLAVFATLRIWRDGSPLGPWLFAAYAPQGLAVLYMAAQMLHLFPVAWQSRYYMIFAVTLSIPLLLHALTLRISQRLNIRGRARVSDTQDALTGLLVRERFMDHVQHAVHRASYDRLPGAIVVIEVANYQHIQAQLGLTVAEQCLLRGVVKLHRVLRDVDPAGRLDIARFGVVLDGVGSRDAVNERMVSLIASGLIPLPGLHPEVTLHFHVAAVVLDEVHPDPRTVIDELCDLLDGIAPRSRRPIRFLEAPTTLPAPLERDSDFDPPEAELVETPPMARPPAPSQPPRPLTPMPKLASRTDTTSSNPAFDPTVPAALDERP
ncbi:7TM diverse intracellular signaling domain-containing protein [Curvibacter sp. APW13]|uniref:7TM diverse intracellular signaling domain-containing protein n=1 Tax=Curvibacter sp. APW13 TaxID=3077236 RepID=UPI0028DFFED7|nr:7TM diverse intracellular signaling domain-containing protein [Curvibacter sp. APW13]MDT8989719.1 7TM diverse intracellular signaling domain-containing protein [Curvibacter sp. APW13]